MHNRLQQHSSPCEEAPKNLDMQHVTLGMQLRSAGCSRSPTQKFELQINSHALQAPIEDT